MPGRIPPSTWGPFFWHTMHLVALGYPNQPTYAEKRAAKEFFESFQYLIPCPMCKQHQASHLKDLPLTPSLDSRKDLFKWTVDMHNLVNQDLGKPQYTEADAIAFQHRLGELGRSPVQTPEDVHALQFGEVAKWGFAALGFAAVAGGVYQYFSGKE